MAALLIVLPQADFDPAEVALPWLVWTRAGHDVAFATETGAAAACDPVTLTGAGLPRLARFLRARALSGLARYDEAIAVYQQYQAALPWISR